MGADLASALPPVRSRRRHARRRARAGLGPRAVDRLVPGLPALLQAPAHRDGGDQRLVRPHARPRAPGTVALRRRERPRGGAALRRRCRGRPHLEGDARRLLLHRVRALPGRLPGLRHRQGALAQAADHGPARCGLRGGRAGARGRRSGAAAAARAGRRQRRGGVGLRDLRRLRAGLPGVDRARRPHRRPAPPPGDGRLALPGRGRADDARRRARVQSVGARPSPSAPTGRRASTCGCSPRARRHPNTSTGSAAPRPSTSGRARRRVRRRGCWRRPGSTSRSSGHARAAAATRRGGWATSTSSRRPQPRTSPRSSGPR